MLFNYLFIALQGLKKQPGFSAIKILSLAIGLGCSILVIMHVQYATSFDKHFPNWERTYRLVTSVTSDQRFDLPLAADVYAPQMRLDYPQIEYIANVREGRSLFSIGGEAASNIFYWAEPEIINILSLAFVSGDPTTALNQPNTVVLNETTAQKYFPNQNAIGQTLTMENQDTDLRVTGVMRDLPENSNLDLQMLISVETGRQIFGDDFMANSAWISFNGTMTYLTLPSQNDGEALARDLANFVTRNIPDEERIFAERTDLTLSLESLGDIYLSPRQGGPAGGGGSKTELLAGLSLFAALILITSCINFANLSLSQVLQRSKEIGVRKTLGANRSQIIIQFIFESLVLTFLALLVAAPLVYLAIPIYTNLTNSGFSASSIFQSSLIIYLTLFVILTGFISGLFPALALSRFQAASIIQGINFKGSFSRYLRPSATVLQFALSTSLIIFAIAINLQINHLNTADNGFNKDNLIVLDSTFSLQTEGEFDYTAMVNELQQHPGVVSISKSTVPPPEIGSINAWSIPGLAPGEVRTARQYYVDQNFADTMQFEFLAGRDFSEDFPADFVPLNLDENELIDTNSITYGVILTRFGASEFNLGSPEEAIGKTISEFRSADVSENIQHRVIGVIEDFRLTGGLENPLDSVRILKASLDPMRALLIRIDPDQMTSALAYIDEVWSRHRPDIPVDRIFYDQVFSDIVNEQTNGISTASIFASIITVLISAFGLYALAFYASEKRTKEIGIRKVLGATSNSIINLLTWDFLKPVLISCVVAWVVGFYAISRYFEQFSSQAEISIFLFVTVTIGTILIAGLTVAFQCYKAAISDPVQSLRYE